MVKTDFQNEAIKQDMPELAFAGHMKYMMGKYGSKKK